MKKNIRIFFFLFLVTLHVNGQTTNLRSFIINHYVAQKTWNEAQAFCRQNHQDLITVHEEQINLIKNIGQEGWIGLYRENKTFPWKWSRGNETATFFQWLPTEPNLLDIEFCVSTSANGYWYNSNCRKVRGYFCYQENLVLVKENKTWEEALDHCRSLGMDVQNSVFETNMPLYDLATLITVDDHNYARDKAQFATTDAVWTGLRFLGDTWLWMGGGEVEYQDIPSCPAFNCGGRKQVDSMGLKPAPKRGTSSATRNLKTFCEPEI